MISIFLGIEMIGIHVFLLFGCQHLQFDSSLQAKNIDALQGCT